MDVPLDDLATAIVLQFSFHLKRSLLILCPVATCKAVFSQTICYNYAAQEEICEIMQVFIKVVKHKHILKILIKWKTITS